MSKKTYYIITAICIAISLVLMGAQVPRWQKQIQIKKINKSIEILSGSIAANKATWNECEATMERVNKENDQLRLIKSERNKQLCELDKKYCEEDKAKVPVKSYVRTYKNIIIHNTATDHDVSLENMKKSMLNKRGRYPAHYIVAKDGTWEKIEDLWNPTHGTKNADINWSAIEIEVIGNFNEYEPAQEQYDTLKYLISEIQSKYPEVRVIGHKDADGKQCPGPLFDWDKLIDWPEEVHFGAGDELLKVDGEYLGEYSFSRYYSPLTGQKEYYPHLSGTYENYLKNKEMNCGVVSNCLVTANGHNLTDADKYKSIACPPEIALGSKIYIEGHGEAICNDRGGAIKGRRIDMRCGIGDDALENWADCPTGKRDIYLIN